MKPNLKFKINKKADIVNAQHFIAEGSYVDLFLPQDLHYIIDNRFSKKEKDKIIKEYTDNIYIEKDQEIKRGMENVKKEWSRVDDRFYEVLDKIFLGFESEQKNYTGIVSIYLMYSRNIQDKIFFFPYKNLKWDPISTISHEIMHFFFFDYIKEKYNVLEETEFRDKDTKYVWQLSETFNTVIENWKTYKDIFQYTGDIKPYSGCEEIYRKMKKQWDKDQSIDILDQWF